MPNINPESLFFSTDGKPIDAGLTKDAITIVGLDRKCLYLSAQLSRILGGRDIDLERGLYDVIHPEDRNKLDTLFNNINKDGTNSPPLEVDFRAVHQDGHSVWLSPSTSNYLDTKGNLIGFIYSLRDITEKKTKELKLHDVLEKYQEAYERIKVYNNLFTHDLKNILGVIQMSSELMRDVYKTTPEQIKNSIKLIQNSVKKGARLLSTIHNLAKLEEEEEIYLEKMEVGKIIDKAIKFVKKSYSNKEIWVDVETPSKRLYILANEFLLDIFKNLLSNGVKFNNSEIIRILIKVSNVISSGKEFIKIEFIDNGIGISEFQKAFLFLHVPTNNNTLKGKGMGLGLSLVKKALDLYGGKMWVEDKVKDDYTKGTNFVILFPQ